MMKRMISALALAFIASSVFASGTVTVFTQGNSEPKTLTDAERLLDLVGQPRLATSWWPAAVIGEEQATGSSRNFSGDWRRSALRKMAMRRRR